MNLSLCLKAFLLFLIFIIPGLTNLYALNLSQLQTEIRRNMRDTQGAVQGQRYSDSSLVDYINEAQREINNYTWLSEKVTSYALTPFTTYYKLPDDCINVLQVKLLLPNGGNNIIDLLETSRDELKTNFPNWEAITSLPNYYWISQTTIATAAGSSTTLLISYIPIPAVQSTGTVKIWYFTQVDDLVNATDVPFNNKRYLYPYHMMISYQVSMRLKAIEGLLEESKYYLDMYQNYLKNMKEKLGTMPNYRPGMNSSIQGRSTRR